MPPENQPKQAKYSYLPLDGVQANTKVNVYGVVKFVKHPYKSRGSDYCMMISIVDESMTGHDQKLKCLLFAPVENKLPPAQVGDVIRFHRLNISRFAGDLQGQSCPGYTWVLFSGDPGGTLEPKAVSYQTFNLPDEEIQKIEDLRTWASGQGLSKTYSRFKNIAAGCYFDSLCQVISTCLFEEEGVCLLLKVWDGTQTIYPVREVEMSDEEASRMNSDTTLMARAEGFVYDVCLFDDHLKNGKKIKPGDYIELCNLHAAVFKTPAVTPLETVELVLHRGSSFGRGVRILQADAEISELKKLKEDLDKIQAQPDSQGSLNDSELVRAAENVHGNTERGKTNYNDNQRPSTSGDSNLQGREQNIRVKPIERVPHSEARASSGENGNKQRQADSSSSSSVQIIESDQNSETGTSSEETSNKRKQAESNGSSSSSVQIVESVQKPKTRNSSRQTEGSSGESVQIIEDVQNPKTSNIGRKQTETNSSESVQIIESVQSPKTSTKHTEVSSSESVSKRKHSNLTSSVHASTSEDAQIDDRDSATSTDASKRCRLEQDIQSAQSIRTVESDTNSERQSGSLQRCMMKTSTIILNHPNVPRTSISDLLKHEMPYKFKVRARVFDYHPKPTSVERFLQLYCHECHYLCSMPGLDSTNNNIAVGFQLQIGSTFRGVPHYNCPRCLSQKDSLQGLDSPPHLSYIYMMRLLLKDDTGWLMTNIWQSDAETFFRDISPEELVQNKRQLKFIQECLQQICPDNVDIEEKPWIECCVKSYCNKEGTGFQIFDTVIA